MTATLLLTSLSAFAMWPAFPSSDYYADSAPAPGHRSAMHLSRTSAWIGRFRERTRTGSHVHCLSIKGGGTQLRPLEHRLGYAADLHRDLPVGHHTPTRKFPHTQPIRCGVGYALRSQPISTRLELAHGLRGLR